MNKTVQCGNLDLTREQFIARYVSHADSLIGLAYDSDSFGQVVSIQDKIREMASVKWDDLLKRQERIKLKQASK